MDRILRWCRYCIPVLLVSVLSVGNLAASEVERLILQPALTLVGSSYATGAMGPRSFDCSGFVNYLYKEHRPDLPRVSRDISRLGEPVSRSDLKPGDLVFFATGSAPGRVTHVAVYLGQDSLIHAISNGPNRGVTVTPLSARYWSARYHSSRRILPAAFYEETVPAETIPASDSVREESTVRKESSGGTAASGENRAPAGDDASKELPTAVPEEKTFAKGRYRGNLKGGEPHGEGVFDLDSGDRFAGMFRDGFPEGDGVYLWTDGKSYEGTFSRGALSGEGSLTFPDNSRLEGVFREGTLRGIKGRSGGGQAASVRTGELFRTGWQLSDSPWDTFNGVVLGDYDLWRAQEERSFESWKKENSPW